MSKGGYTMSRVERDGHWIDMPEFQQEKKEPFRELIVRFANQEDFDEFCELIDQKLTHKTKSTWHPALGKNETVLRYFNAMDI